MSLKLGRLNPSKTLLLLCDMQHKFSGIITHFNEVAESSSRIAQTANLLNMKTLITEHYPKGKLLLIIQIQNKLLKYSPMYFKV